MASATGGHSRRPGLVAARERLGLTQEQAAERVGVSPTTWARWEQGRQGIRAYARARLVKVFGVAPQEVERWIEGADAQPLPWLSDQLNHSTAAAALDEAAELWRWDVDPSRRRVLGNLPFVPSILGEWLLVWAYDPSGPTRAGRVGSARSVGSDDVRRIHEARRAFTQMDHQFGGGLVRPAVMDYLNSQVAPLLRGTYSDEVGAQLMTAAAGMTRLAGWEAYDLGRNGLAQAHFGHALRLCKTGDDQLTAAWVLVALAQQACDLQHPEWAMRLSRAAQHAGQRVGACPRVRALLSVREARATALGVALAEVRDAHAVARIQRLIDRAEQAFDQAKPGDEEPTWIAPLGAAELTAEIGCTWRLIGDNQRAEACARQALRGFGPRFPRSVQFNTVHLAEAYLGQGELDAALDQARAAVPMAKTLTSRRTVARLIEFDRTLDPYVGERRVRGWREYLCTNLPAA